MVVDQVDIVRDVALHAVSDRRTRANTPIPTRPLSAILGPKMADKRGEGAFSRVLPQ